jgi:catechol 2,3-dioxygenase-like lactoylglutathione lyase family enzyme
MPVAPLHHVSISVKSLDNSLYFYRTVLGMKVTLEATIDDDSHVEYLRLRPNTSGRVAMLQVGPPIGAVQLIEWSNTDLDSSPLRPGDPGAFLLAFELREESMDEFLSRLKEYQIQPWTSPKTSNIPNYGTIRTVVLEDPDGVMIEILELPTRDSILRTRQQLERGDKPDEN